MVLAYSYTYRPIEKNKKPRNKPLHIWRWASLVAQRLKRLPAMRETRVRSLGWEDSQCTVLYFSIRPSLIIGLLAFSMLFLPIFFLFDLVPPGYITPGEKFTQNSVLKLSWHQNHHGVHVKICI